MSLRSRACLFMLLLLTTAAESTAETTVGLLGDCARIEFTGNQVYTADLIRKELAKDLEILVAGRTEASLSDWLVTLESRLQFGYRTDGYAEVRVAARVDEARGVVIVDVQEGPQYLCGEIEIVGAKTLPVDEFRQLMSITRLERHQQEGQPPIPPGLPPNDRDLCPPMWIKGKVARCANSYWKTRSSSFRSIFQSLGYFDPKVFIDVRLETDKTATLVIDIHDEGPRSTLDSFEVMGLTKNTPQDLIRYLDIPLGTPLNLDVKRQIERKLWDSARFREYHVSIVPPKRGDNPAHTKVDIFATEFDEAPLLSEPLSPEQQAFLRLFQWLAAIDETKDDLHTTIKVATSFFNECDEEETDEPADADQPDQYEPEWFVKFDAIISSQHKALFVSAELLDSDGKSLVGYALHMTPNRLQIDSIGTRTRFEMKDFDAKLILNFDWSYKDGEERPERLMMGAGYGTRRSTSAPFQVRAVVPPALVLHLFEREVKTLELNDQFASIDLGEGKRFTFDQQTGVIHNLKLEEHLEAIEVAVGPDLYSDFIAKYEESMAGARVTTPGDQPATSFVRFLCESIKGSPIPRLARLSRLGQRMVQRDSFRGVDALLNRFVFYLGDDEFWIPDNSPSKLVRDHSSWSPYLYQVTEAFLPKNELSRTVIREMTLAQVMRNYHETSDMVAAFAEGKTGPTTDVLVSTAFRWLGVESPNPIDIKWPKEITLDAFHRDCELFLNDDWAVGQLLLGLTAAVQGSDEDQIDDLTAVASALIGDVEFLRPLLMLVREQHDKPPREALLTVLDGLWDAALCPAFSVMLKVSDLDESFVPPSPKISEDSQPSTSTRR